MVESQIYMNKIKENNDQPLIFGDALLSLQQKYKKSPKQKQTKLKIEN